MPRRDDAVHRGMFAALAKAISNGKGEAVADASWLLLDQARIQEGETLTIRPRLRSGWMTF